MTPKRIQRKRTRGWRKPENTVDVTRSTRWGNPCRIGMFKGYDALDAVRDFKKWINRDPAVASFNNAFGEPPSEKEIRDGLAGKNLMCWCAKGQPCHADVLLKIANA